MEISVRQQDGVDLLEVHGRLTIGEPAEQLNEALQSIVQRGGRKVVINLNGVPQIDSSGISSLVRISIQLAREGGAVISFAAPERPRLLTVTRLVEAIPTTTPTPPPRRASRSKVKTVPRRARPLSTRLSRHAQRAPQTGW